MHDRRRIALIAAAMVVVGVAGVWWFFLRSDAPPPVSLDDAVSAVSTTPPGSGEQIEGAGPIDGPWRVVPGQRSFAGYRVVEELATIGVTEAAGRTGSVRASLRIDAGTVRDVEVSVDMRSLRSDSGRRDGALRTQALETDTFPEARFVLTEPIVLPDDAAAGTAFSVTAVGDLTLHGVTRSVELAIEAQLVDGVIAIVGSTEISFADYDIDQPRSMALLSVDDRGLMEFQLLFERG